MAKIVYEIQYSGRRDKIVKGTLDELNQYFGESAKSIKSLVSRVQRKYEEREAACYNRTFISLVDNTSKLAV